MEEIQKHLFELQDMAYRDFHSRLMPGIDKETIIGIRVPVLRKYARFGIGMLMRLYLDTDFDPEYVRIVAEVKSDEYYVNMMIAWYMATALAKQWDVVIPYIEEHRMPDWVHRKTIQKAVESYRITDEQKRYLKGYR